MTAFNFSLDIVDILFYRFFGRALSQNDYVHYFR